MNNARSFSDISTFRRCPNLYKYRSVLNLQRQKQNTDLYQGTLVHEALMDYYLGGNEEAFWHEKMLEAKANPMLFSDELADQIIIIEDSADLVARYLEKYDDDWEILHVEEEFYVTLAGGQVVSFTPDLVVRDRNGFVWIIDHKTTSALPKQDIYADLQSLLYYAGVQALYPELRGFIFNYLRKKRPTQPRLTKTGKLRVSDVNRIDTTYEVLRDFIQSNAPQLMDDDMHRRRLAELRDEERFFWRTQLVIGEEEVETVLREATVTLEWMEMAERMSSFPRTFQEDRGYMSCGKCAFQRLCHAELVGWDADRVLEEDYEQRPPKNPYEGVDVL